MAQIKIANLQPAGFDLFNDSESYLNNLTKNEITSTNGGSAFGVGVTVGIIITILVYK